MTRDDFPQLVPVFTTLGSIRRCGVWVTGV